MFNWKLKSFQLIFIILRNVSRFWKKPFKSACHWCRGCGFEPHSTLTGFELGFHFLLLTFLGPLKCTVVQGLCFRCRLRSQSLVVEILNPHCEGLTVDIKSHIGAERPRGRALGLDSVFRVGPVTSPRDFIEGERPHTQAHVCPIPSWVTPHARTGNDHCLCHPDLRPSRTRSQNMACFSHFFMVKCADKAINS